MYKWLNKVMDDGNIDDLRSLLEYMLLQTQPVAIARAFMVRTAIKTMKMDTYTEWYLEIQADRDPKKHAMNSVDGRICKRLMRLFPNQPYKVTEKIVTASWGVDYTKYKLERK
jgi:hypothetical protein